MTQHVNGFSEPTPFPALSKTRIAQLSPQNNSISWLEAVVTLVWPYSSSTDAISLLLAESDILLRKSKGQVKVTFHGICGRTVAESQVGIGDIVKLSTTGAQWINTGDVTATPGKKIDWDLEYTTRALVAISRPARDLHYVDFKGQPDTSDVYSDASRRRKEVITNGVSVGVGSSTTLEVSSPAFSRFHTLSAGSFVDASLDPFADDDGFVVGKGRKRTKFARHSGTWRLLSSPTPPRSRDSTEELEQYLSDQHVAQGDQAIQNVLETDAIDAELVTYQDPAQVLHTPIDGDSTQMISSSATYQGEALASSADVELLESVTESPEVEIHQPTDQTITTMPPPKTPLKSVELAISMDEIQEVTATATPRLLPLASPALPFVSPLIPQTGGDYFNAKSTGQSELDAMSDGVHELQDIPAVSNRNLSATDISATHTADLDQFMDGLKDGTQHLRPSSDSDLVQNLPASSLVLRLPSQQAYVDLTESPTESAQVSSFEVVSLANENHLDKQATVQDLEIEEHVRHSSIPVEETHVPYDPKVQRSQSSTLSQDIRGTYDNIRHSGIATDITIDLADSEVVPDMLTQSTVEPKPEIAETSLRPPTTQDESAVFALDRDGVDPQATPEVDYGDSSQATLKAIPEVGIPFMLTPEATQRDQLLPTISLDTAFNRDGQMLPTPEKTQEQRPLEIHQVDGNGDDQESAQDVLVTERLHKASEATDTRVRGTRLSSRISVPIQRSQITSPYFSPRSSTKPILAPRLTPPPPTQTFVASIDNAEVVHDLRSRRIKEMVQDTTGNEHLPIKDHIARTQKSATGLATDLSYYVELAYLSEHFNRVIDILAVCTTSSVDPHQRAKAGPRDYYTTVHLTDQSLQPSNTVTAQLFRPYKKALPKYDRGDVILLRDVKVQSQKRKCMLLSTQSSAWAVFGYVQIKQSDEFELHTRIAGPPVEYGDLEQEHVMDLLDWWKTEGNAMYPELVTEEDKAESPKEKEPLNDTEGSPISPRRSRRLQSQPPEGADWAPDSKTLANEENAELVKVQVTIDDHESSPTSPRRSRRLQSHPPESTDGAVDEKQWPSSPPLPTTKARRRSDVSIISQGPRSRRHGGSHRSESVILELRDGTTYVDDDESLRSTTRNDDSLVHELRDGLTWIDQ